MELVIKTIDIVGKVMIAFTAIMVHHRVLAEKRVDAKVLVEMRHEQIIGVIGVILIILAYLLEISVLV